MARELSLGQSTTASRLRQFSIQPEGFAHLRPQAFARHFRTMAEKECRCTGCDVSDGNGGARQTSGSSWQSSVSTQRLTFNSWIAQLIQDSGMIMGDHGKGNGKAAQRSAKETEAVGAATGGDSMVRMDRCRRCGRPSSLFGSTDRKTGWRGWCFVCNWKWHYADGLTYGVWKLHLQTQGTLPESVLRYVRPFLVDSVQAQSDWCAIRLKSLIGRWTRILTPGVWTHHHGSTPEVHDEQTGEIRPVDTDDEDEETGVWDAHLNYTNPLWKMQLADGPHSPMEILGEFLGMCYIPD